MEEDIIEKGSDESSLGATKPAKKRGRPAKSAQLESDDSGVLASPAKKRGRKPKSDIAQADALQTSDVRPTAKKRAVRKTKASEDPADATAPNESSDFSYDSDSRYGDPQSEENIFVHHGEDDFAYAGNYSSSASEDDSSEVPERFSTSDEDLRHDSYFSGEANSEVPAQEVSEAYAENSHSQRGEGRDFRNRGNRNNQNRQWNQGGNQNNKMRQQRGQFDNNRNNGRNNQNNQQRNQGNNQQRNQNNQNRNQQRNQGNQQRSQNNQNRNNHHPQNHQLQKKKLRWAHLQNREDDVMNPANLPDWDVLKNEEFLAEYVLAYLGNEEALARIEERKARNSQQIPTEDILKNSEAFAYTDSKEARDEEKSSEEKTAENAENIDKDLREIAENEEASARAEVLDSENSKESDEEKSDSESAVAATPKRAPISLVGDWFVESPEEIEEISSASQGESSSEISASEKTSVAEDVKISSADFLGARDLNLNALYSLDLRSLQNFFEESGIGYRKGQGKGAMFGEFFKYVSASKKLLKISGVLDIFENGEGGALCFESDSYALKRACAYVPRLLIEKYSLQRGHELAVLALPPREGSEENCPVAVKVCTVMGEAPEKAADVVPFTDLTPYYPTRRMIMEADSKCGWDNLSMRVVDLLAPIGLGQRALIVAPPRTGKTVLMQGMAKSIRRNTPDAHVIVLLVDERPEEVTDFQRNVDAEVVASTFDAEAINHVHAAEIVISKARRMVEKGRDVVILLDSITRLARAYNALMPGGGRTMSGGIEASALQKPKKFFGSARNIEGGGSLTIIGTALVETGSKMDDVIFEEFKGTGNLELHLDRSLSDKRIFPSINMEKSGTRKEELLYHTEELPKIYALRRAMKGVSAAEAMELLTQRLKKVKTNVEFLMGLNR